MALARWRDERSVEADPEHTVTSVATRYMNKIHANTLWRFVKISSAMLLFISPSPPGQSLLELGSS